MSDNPLSTESTSSLVERAKGLLMTPATEWAKIAAETKSPKEVLLGYALPLAAISPVCTILGSFLSPISLGLPFTISLALASFVLGLAGLFLLAFVANFLAPNFGGKNDYASAFKLVAYAYTPTWLAGVLGLVTGFAPILAILIWVAMAYGLYLFYLGTTPVMSVPQDKSVVYVVIYVVCAIVVSILVGAIAGAIVTSFVVASMPSSTMTITYS